MPNIAYNAEDHALYLTTFDDVTFSTDGEIDGDFLVITYDNDAISAVEGAKGKVQFSQRIASLGNAQVAVQWGSQFNEVLQQAFRDQQQGNYLQRAELKRISNTENTTVCTSINPKIMKVADYTIGTVAGDRTWNLKLENLSFEEVQDPA